LCLEILNLARIVGSRFWSAYVFRKIADFTNVPFAYPLASPHSAEASMVGGGGDKGEII
jgi:hypothetical protein